MKKNCDELVVELDKYKSKKTQTVERILNRAFTQVLFSGLSHIELSDVLISIMVQDKCKQILY